jgi:hypothetical protein
MTPMAALCPEPETFVNTEHMNSLGFYSFFISERTGFLPFGYDVVCARA